MPFYWEALNEAKDTISKLQFNVMPSFFYAARIAFWQDAMHCLAIKQYAAASKLRYGGKGFLRPFTTGSPI